MFPPKDSQEKQTNALGPDTKTPEQLEAYKELETEFNSKYADIFSSVGEKHSGIVGKIRGNYCLNGGKIDEAVQTALKQSGANEEQIQNVLTKIHTEKKSPEKKQGGETSGTSFDTLSNAEKTPEYDTMQRLVDEGHISKQSWETCQQETAGKDTSIIKSKFKEVIATIPDKSLQAKINKKLFPSDTNDTKNKDGESDKSDGINTEKEFTNSDFYKDFGSVQGGKAPDFSDFNTMLANNYTTIPSSNGSGGNKKADLESAFNASAKKIVASQSHDFTSRNSNHINQALSKNSTIKEKYTALKTLFDESQIESGLKSKQTKKADNDGKGEKSKKLDQIFDSIQSQNQANLSLQAQQKSQIAQREAQEKMAELQKSSPEAGNISSLQGGQMDVATSGAEKPTSLS